MGADCDSHFPADAKGAIPDYRVRNDALTAGVADLEAVERMASVGHGPSDLMPRVQSVISPGVGGRMQCARRLRAAQVTPHGERGG